MKCSGKSYQPVSLLPGNHWRNVQDEQARYREVMALKTLDSINYELPE